MKKKITIIFLLINLIIGYFAFNLQPTKIDYNLSEEKVEFLVPNNFPKPIYDFKGNLLTPTGFKLGRLLFYDRQLSLDQSISCGSCHQSSSAFSNFNRPVSRGVKGCAGNRNAPGLFNLAWQRGYMWDGRIDQFDLSSHNAIINPCEMANDFDHISARLQAIKVYPVLFKKAFGDSTIKSKYILNALTQFIAMLVSANSKYDKYIRKEPGGNFNDEEQEGYILFRQKCKSCHQEPLFTDRTYRNNGLDVRSLDKGRDSLTRTATDVGKFRVPSLRNLEVTAPYMHDGRFATLNEVLAHYDHGVQPNPNLDPELKSNARLGISLSFKEQNKILAFLKTLTDKNFINDIRFQTP